MYFIRPVFWVFFRVIHKNPNQHSSNINILKKIVDVDMWITNLTTCNYFGNRVDNSVDKYVDKYVDNFFVHKLSTYLSTYLSTKKRFLIK
jgi:hypothetical protein